ncbi:MAG: heavy-metal-associated domain-containing protein, partial [Victivallales bacterium]|nr:heavy-metal-associated domain-containing protein [Victivallales bacterium]
RTNSIFPHFLFLYIFHLCFLAALYHTIRHFKGAGGCCGGASVPPPVSKESTRPAVARRRLHIEGMSCMHCVNRVTQALNALDGVIAQVQLNPPTAIVTLEQEVADEMLRKAVADAGFQITDIEEMPLP